MSPLAHADGALQRLIMANRPPRHLLNLCDARLRRSALVAPILACLCQCAGPLVPGTPRPFSDERENYRAEAREWDQRQNQYAYERGLSDGKADASAGEPKSYDGHEQSYTLSTRGAYIAGYDAGYAEGDSQNPSVPGYPPETRVERDPAYNQGYDYGLRDRVAGRPADVDAHTGSFDPRFRRSFESGYLDAYESRRGN